MPWSQNNVILPQSPAVCIKKPNHGMITKQRKTSSITCRMYLKPNHAMFTEQRNGSSITCHMYPKTNQPMITEQHNTSSITQWLYLETKHFHFSLSQLCYHRFQQSWHFWSWNYFLSWPAQEPVKGRAKENHDMALYYAHVMTLDILYTMTLLSFKLTCNKSAIKLLHGSNDFGLATKQHQVVCHLITNVLTWGRCSWLV